MSVGSRPLPVAPRRAGRKRARDAEGSDATNKGSVTRRPRCCLPPAPPSAGPRAAVALSDWLGDDALLSTRPAASSEGVGLLGQMLQAGAALPRHVALLAAALTSVHRQQETTTEGGTGLVRLAAVKGLGALGPSLLRPHLPLLVDRMGQDPCDRVRAAAVAAATGAYNARVAPLAHPYMPAVIAVLADGSPCVRRAAVVAIVGRLASHVGSEDVEAIAQLLRARAAPTREAALRALDGMLASSSSTTTTTTAALRALHGNVATLASKDPLPTIRLLALTFLSRLPPPLAFPHLGSTLLPRLGDGHAEVQAAAVAALERLRDHHDPASPNLFSDALRRHARLLVGLFTRPPGGRMLALGAGMERARRTRTVVLQVLSSFLPPAALEPFVTELAAAVGWGRAAGAVQKEEEVGEEDQEKEGKQHTRRALAPMPVGSPSSSPSSPARGRGSSGSGSNSSPRASSSPSSSRPRRLVFEEEAHDQEDVEAAAATDNNEEGEQAIQEGMLALLGQMPTVLLLPHAPAVARRLLLPKLLADPRSPDAANVAAVAALLTSIKNPELRRQCLSHLLAQGLDGGPTAGQYGRRRRVLRLLLRKHLEASIFPLLPCVADALAACLTDPALHVRRDACLVLLRGAGSSILQTKQQQQLPWRAALVACLRREGDLGWLVKACEGDGTLREAVVAVVEGEEEEEGAEDGRGKGKENADKGDNVQVDLRQLLRGEGKGSKKATRPSRQGAEKVKQD